MSQGCTNIGGALGLISYPVVPSRVRGWAQRSELKVRRRKDSEEQGWPRVVWGSAKCWNLMNCSLQAVVPWVRKRSLDFIQASFFCDTYLARLPRLPYVCKHQFLARPTFICPSISVYAFVPTNTWTSSSLLVEPCCDSLHFGGIQFHALWAWPGRKTIKENKLALEAFHYNLGVSWSFSVSAQHRFAQILWPVRCLTCLQGIDSISGISVLCWHVSW